MRKNIWKRRETQSKQNNWQNNPTQSDSNFRSLAWQEDNNVTAPHDRIQNTSKFERNCRQTKSRSRNATWQIAGGRALTSYYQDSTAINKKRSFRQNVTWRTTSYRGIVPSPSSTSVGMKRAWSSIKLLHSKSMATPALFWKNRVCAKAMSKAEALREQHESFFKKEDLNNVPILPESPYGDIPDVTFCSPDIQIESIRPKKALDLIKIPARVLKESTFELAPIFGSFFRQSFWWRRSTICLEGCKHHCHL